MEFFASVGITKRFDNPVLTIGNYDGVHRGHREIIDRVKEKARAISGTAMLMTFYPHPLRFLRPEEHLGLITPLYVKKKLIEEAGINVLFVIPFTAAFRSMAPETFIEDVLVRNLGIKSLIVGYDFRFGMGGRGDTAMLKAYSDRYGYDFSIVDAITVNHEKVGSNRIRHLILDGRVAEAAVLLGRPYIVEGEVVPGDGRGAGIGFPTVNLDTAFEIIPGKGVYITEALVRNRRIPSVTNVGYNPTFDGKELRIEAHLLDFSEDLYYQEVTLAFLERVRDEQKFGGVEELKQRIAADVAAARRYFEKTGSPLGGERIQIQEER